MNPVPTNPSYFSNIIQSNIQILTRNSKHSDWNDMNIGDIQTTLELDFL
jgi:hypothetical protein